jgi:hypothetical protein
MVAERRGSREMGLGEKRLVREVFGERRLVRDVFGEKGCVKKWPGGRDLRGEV